MTTKPLEYSAASHPGLTRSNNEDCFLSKPEQGLWLVADGMGGHEAGEVASGVVAGKGIDEVGGGLPYLECLVHGSGLTVFVIVVSDSGGGGRGEKSLGANNQFRNL